MNMHLLYVFAPAMYGALLSAEIARDGLSWKRWAWSQLPPALLSLFYGTEGVFWILQVFDVVTPDTAPFLGFVAFYLALFCGIGGSGLALACFPDPFCDDVQH